MNLETMLELQKVNHSATAVIPSGYSNGDGAVCVRFDSKQPPDVIDCGTPEVAARVARVMDKMNRAMWHYAQRYAAKKQGVVLCDGLGDFPELLLPTEQAGISLDD